MGIVSGFQEDENGGKGGEKNGNYEHFFSRKLRKLRRKAHCLIVQALVSLGWCRGREEDWIKIQANTFKNWINVNLRETGLTLEDLSTDFSDGVRCVTARFYTFEFLLSDLLLLLMEPVSLRLLEFLLCVCRSCSFLQLSTVD